MAGHCLFVLPLALVLPVFVSCDSRTTPRLVARSETSADRAEFLWTLEGGSGIPAGTEFAVRLPYELGSLKSTSARPEGEGGPTVYGDLVENSAVVVQLVAAQDEGGRDVVEVTVRSTTRRPGQSIGPMSVPASTVSGSVSMTYLNPEGIAVGSLARAVDELPVVGARGTVELLQIQGSPIILEYGPDVRPR